MPVTTTRSRWNAGNLEFLDSSGNVIAIFDGTNRKLSIPAGSTLEVLGSLSSLASAVLSKAANFSVTAAESGTVYLITGVDKVASLPATAAGLRFTFIVTAAALSAGTGFAISPVAADKIMNNGITSADNKDLINTAATDAEGDSISLVGDGVDGWIVTSQRGTWARET